LDLRLNKLIKFKFLNYGIRFVNKTIEFPFDKIGKQAQLDFKKVYNFDENLDHISYELYLNLAKFLLKKKRLFVQQFKEDLVLRWKNMLKQTKMSEKHVPYEDFAEFNINKNLPFYSNEIGEIFIDYLVLGDKALNSYMS